MRRERITVALLNAVLIVLVSLNDLALGQGSSCPMVADVVLCLDQSTSIVAAPGGFDNWEKYIIGFALYIAQAFPISPTYTQMGVIKFGTTAVPAIYFSEAPSYDILEKKIKALEIDGGETNIADALLKTRQVMFSPSYGGRSNVPHIMILVTDGQANVNINDTLPQANATKMAGIEIFTVGMTSQIDTRELQAICSSPWETHYFYVDDYSKLATIIQDLISKLCNT